MASTLFAPGSNVISSQYLTGPQAIFLYSDTTGVGAITAPITATVSLETGYYIIQLFLKFGATSPSAGTTATQPNSLTSTGNDAWPNLSILPATIPAAAGAASTYNGVGIIQGGSQTFTFTPCAGLNLGGSGSEIAFRLIKLS
jgi:hypothetical protein